jgi:phosphatidylserine synthase
MINLTLGLCAVIITAGAHQPFLNLLATGLVSVAFASLAIRENRALIEAREGKSAIAGSTARYIGLVWTWGALALLVIYQLVFENAWPEWWQFFLSFMTAAVGCIIFSNMLARDAKENKEDESVMSLGRLLVKLQLIGMSVGVISLFIDGKFPRETTHPDWAACNIFFFGGIAIAAICANALASSRS